MQIRIRIHIIDTLTTTNTMSSKNSQYIFSRLSNLYIYIYIYTRIIYTTHWVPFCTHRWVANNLDSWGRGIDRTRRVEPTWRPHYELEDYWLVVGG